MLIFDLKFGITPKENPFYCKVIAVEVALNYAQCIIASHEQSIGFYYRVHSSGLRFEKS